MNGHHPLGSASLETRRHGGRRGLLPTASPTWPLPDARRSPCLRVSSGAKRSGWWTLFVLLLLPSCALFEGRRQAADCVTRNAARVRTGLAELARSVPEPARPAVAQLARETLSIEKWGRALGEDFKSPELRLELGGDAEDLGRATYLVAARTKNAIIETIPLPQLPGGGNLLGLLAGTGAGLTGLAGIAAAFVRRKLKAIAADRDHERAAADDFHDVVEDLKGAAKNGGLEGKRFREIMDGHAPAQEKHAERKLTQVRAS